MLPPRKVKLEAKKKEDEKVMLLVKNGCLKQAFELTNMIFYCIGNTDMADSDGNSSYTVDRCYE